MWSKDVLVLVIREQSQLEYLASKMGRSSVTEVVTN